MIHTPPEVNKDSLQTILVEGGLEKYSNTIHLEVIFISYILTPGKKCGSKYHIV